MELHNLQSCNYILNLIILELELIHGVLSLFCLITKV